ncbi:small heat shock protein [Mycena pura]|uniref:Small heat shock protein n=1 Tax=Mycena pura TaxID=153505 RepID=A0AAD6UU96_9AGAR|nr:small heat shock protein [Mycena pura]
MSVFYYEPFADFERLVNDGFRSHSGGGSGNTNFHTHRPVEGDDSVQAFRPRQAHLPVMDLHENTGSNTVTATFELPGIKKEDVHIETLPGRLRISAESKMSEEHQKGGHVIRERRFGKYARTLQIPQGIRASQIKASMENGVLTVTFPKTTSELAPKSITIA